MIGAGAAGTAANDALHVVDGKVAVLCPLTIGGSFQAKTDAVSGELSVTSSLDEPVRGEVVVDLGTLETGIGLRDRHLRERYLEVQRGAEFTRARLQEIRIAALAGSTTFRGVLALHGARQAVSGSATITPHADGYRVEAAFPVRISDFQIPDPTYLGVGVKDEVQVRVNFTVRRVATAVRR
jgi:polyisoprenoid-binding protein YceI